MSGEKQLGDWPSNLENFPLTVGHVLNDYTRLPSDLSNGVWHYTTREGLKGILRSGGLRATYRKHMNDPGEFSYPRSIVDQTLDELGRGKHLPLVAQRLVANTRLNLSQLLEQSSASNCSYCACLSFSSDDHDLWKKYADEARGFAIAFDFRQILNTQLPNLEYHKPHLVFAPVTYDLSLQKDLTRRLIKSGISDMQRFVVTFGGNSEELTALCDRVIREILVYLIVLADFVKAPAYTKERELRLILQPNDGTRNARAIEYSVRHGQHVPHIFMDLRSPMSGRLTPSEIMIGPEVDIPQGLEFVETLLDELSYGSAGFNDRPKVTSSGL